MHHIQKSAVLPYTPAQIFALVEDIPAYPSFLPWCGGARVITRENDEVLAEIVVAHGALQKSFSSRNRYQRHKMVEMRLVNGPFRVLEGFWRFDPVQGGTRVSLDLQFDFSSRLLGIMLGPLFRHATETMVAAFERRAYGIYGADRVAADEIPAA